MASLRVFLIFEIIIVLFPSELNFQILFASPQNYFNLTCDLADGKEGYCVDAFLCRDNVINVDGAGIVDLRFSDDCENYLLKCCSIETACEDNKGTCVPANRCEAEWNSPNYKIFRESDECEWNDYKCCPNEKVKEPSNPVAECDVDSICVPDADCLVQPDGNGLLEARSSICSGTETCCPRRQIRKTVTSPCQEIGGQCVPQGQCSSVFSVDIRITTCDEPGFECCMESPATTASTPFLGKSCVRGSGKCVPRKECKGTVYRDRDNECGGLVCCAGAVEPSVTSTTTSRPVTSWKSCMNNSGMCTQRNQCKGTVYKDRYNECEGSVCCATLTPAVILPIGKSCFNNNGKCTLKNECEGVVYRDRHNECEGLVCCATQRTTDPTTPPTIPTPTTTRKPVTLGKSCLDNSGKCTQRKDCQGTVYRDRKNECDGLVCCATATEPVRTCNSMKGTCVADQSCLRKTTHRAVDCSTNTVCCLEVEIEVKECGYRNEKGIKFNTINRNDRESQYGEFPWMVAIMVNEAGVSKYVCSGSLIHPGVVLTSAECVKKYRRTSDDLTIRGGEWDMASTLEPIPHQERRVMKIISHSGFQPHTLLNNVALVFLDDEFNLGSTVNTICLPPQNFQIDNGEVTGTGWGSTPQDRKKYQQILKSIDLPYTPKSDCERKLQKATSNRSFKLHPSFICAGGETGVDTCAGDAGAPIIYYIPDDVELRYYAVGMVSWGVGCGRAGTPAVYTDIGVFKEWIDREMEQEGLSTSYYEYVPV